jgi:hypothetical protein
MITFIVEKTHTGYSAYNEDFPIATTGSSFSDLLYNATEAYNLYLEGTGRQINEKDIRLEIDLKQFFRYYRVINAKFLAKRIGMNESLLSQYVRGRKKPSPKQARRILLGVQEIGRELSNLHLFAD